MTPLLFAWLSLAGGIGAAFRLFVDGMIRAHIRFSFPLATTVINVTGSLALGIVTGLGLRGMLSPEWRLIIGTGFLGGYTTFSTASFETVRLLQERRTIAAALNGLATLIVSVGAAGLGLWLGALLSCS